MLDFNEFKSAVRIYGLHDALIMASYLIPISTALLYVRYLKGSN